MFRQYYDWKRARGRALLPAIAVATLLTAGAAILAMSSWQHTTATAQAPKHIAVSSQAKQARQYSPTSEQWAMLTIEPAATSLPVRFCPLREHLGNPHGAHHARLEARNELAERE